jgi:hypothetical protein
VVRGGYLLASQVAVKLLPPISALIESSFWCGLI